MTAAEAHSCHVDFTLARCHFLIVHSELSAPLRASPLKQGLLGREMDSVATGLPSHSDLPL